MAEVAQDEYESQLSKLKAAIDSHKAIIEIKFAEVVAACGERKRELLERLDRTLAECEQQLRASQGEYRRLVESRRILSESLRENGNEDSLSQCFSRMDTEIAKKRPKGIPHIDLAWNTQTILASIENMCVIRSEVRSARKTVSLTNVHTYLPDTDTDSREIARSASWREPESMSADLMVATSIPEEKIPCILQWQKERPTLEREVVYADNRDGTFRLEWNGECFEKSNIELRVGEHRGLLLLSDSSASATTDSFLVASDTRGLQVFTLHLQDHTVSDTTVKLKESAGEETQMVRLGWKKQHPTLNTQIEYIDSRNDSITLQWNGELFQSQPVPIGVGTHHGMLSLGDSDSLPLVEQFSVWTAPGVQEVLLDTPNKQ